MEKKDRKNFLALPVCDGSHGGGEKFVESVNKKGGGLFPEEREKQNAE